MSKGLARTEMPDASISQLQRTAGISRNSAAKWACVLEAAEAAGKDGRAQ
jgi:hypothetical protein